MNTKGLVLVIVAFGACLCLSTSFCDGSESKPAGEFASDAEEQRIEGLSRFIDARFGMFIHWGPVSLTGHEIGWSRGRETSIEEYDRLYKRFNPEQFDADQWVMVAKDAGMKYIILTTKHHDGFCLWDTKQTDYNIMNSPFGRDVVKELAAACKKHGIFFGTYYSTCDWHHPDFPRTSPGGRVRRKQHDLDRYTDYLKAQVRELLVNYGPLFTLWFDVPQEFDAKRGQGVIDLVRSLQPDIVINNRTGAKGDFDTPEQRVGVFQTDRPWETCMTICRQWAWKPDDKMKPFKQCIQTLLKTVGGDGNLLFNVGPMPDGRIEPRQVDRLKEMGDWLKQYGETVYGTRGGPFKPGLWGVSTHKGSNIYVHVMNFSGESITLPAIDKKIAKVKLLTGGAVSMAQSSDGVMLTVPKEYHNDVVTIIELTLDGDAGDIAPVSLPSLSLTAGKKATASNVYQNQTGMFGPQKACDDDDGTRWATDSNTKIAWLQVDLGKAETFSQAVIKEAYAGRVRKFELQKLVGKKLETFHAGTMIGDNAVIKFEAVTAQKVRLNILEASDGPTINEFQLLK